MVKNNFYENSAVNYLKMLEYSIIERNFQTKEGEIDIIAKKGKEISFIEVKARHFNSLVSGKEAVDKNKQEKIIKSALFYLFQKKIKNYNFSFDVLEITEGTFWRQYSFYKGAFEIEGNLQKRI